MGNTSASLECFLSLIKSTLTKCFLIQRWKHYTYPKDTVSEHLQVNKALILNTELEWLGLKWSSLMEKALGGRSVASIFSQVSSFPLLGKCESVAAGQPSAAQGEGVEAPGLWPVLANQSCAFLMESEWENAPISQGVLLSWELCSCPARKWTRHRAESCTRAQGPHVSWRKGKRRSTALASLALSQGYSSANQIAAGEQFLEMTLHYKAKNGKPSTQTKVFQLG